MAGLFCFLRRDFKIYFFLLQSNRGPLVPVKSKRNATTQAVCTDTGAAWGTCGKQACIHTIYQHKPLRNNNIRFKSLAEIPLMNTNHAPLLTYNK